MLDRHGADHPLRSKVIKEKRKKTVTDRFGCDPLALPENRMHLSEAGQKGYRSLVLKRGDVVLSKPEARLHQFLVNVFGQSDVEQQFIVEHDNGKQWLVDFYVKSIDTYIQMDGVFWHGLNRSYEELHPRTKLVYDKDRQQDSWFADKGKKLVRVTDQLLIQCERSNDYASIMERLGG
jgi:hypothetical protein